TARSCKALTSSGVQRVLAGTLVAILAAALLAQLWASLGSTQDDAFISYRYARNLAEGNGLVYNSGERVEGYTNFLWTVLLAALTAAGADPVRIAPVLGAAALAALTLVLALDTRRRSAPALPRGGWSPAA